MGNHLEGKVTAVTDAEVSTGSSASAPAFSNYQPMIREAGRKELE